MQAQNTNTEYKYRTQIQKYKGVKVMRRDPQAISCC